MHHRSRALGLIGLALALTAQAQITIASWPQVRVGILAVDSQGHPLPTLAASDLAVKENGKPVKLAAVTPNATPMSVCILVDLYQSGDINVVVRKQRWDYLREAISRFIDTLPAQDDICLSSFSTPGGIALNFTTSRPAIMEAFDLANATAGGSPAILVSTASYMQRWSHHPDRAIVLFSFYPEDAFDDPSFTHAIQQAGIPALHVIQVPRLEGVGVPPSKSRSKDEHEKNEKTNRNLATRGGGLSFFPWDKKELMASVDHLAEALKNRYVLTYESENLNKDGRERRIVVELEKVHQSRGDVVSAPKGYYGPSR